MSKEIFLKDFEKIYEITTKIFQELVGIVVSEISYKCYKQFFEKFFNFFENSRK